MAGRTSSVFVSSRGVVVTNPDRPDPFGAGAAFLDAASVHWQSGPRQRGRSYARDGSVRHLTFDGASVITSEVRGSGSYRYSVTIRGFRANGDHDLAAECDCPYGNRYLDWCKHAIAVALAAAAMLDDPSDTTFGATSTVADVDLDAVRALAGRLTPQPELTGFDPDRVFAEAEQDLPFPGIVAN